jgi:DNA-binding transcriptional LysR family regulator
VTSLRSKNLNLLPILRALLREESVAKAAEEISLSQSAVSGALARLREELGDPLLIRVGQSMRLTSRAQRLRKQLDNICEEIEGLFEPDGFDPQSATNSFVIAAPDYLVYLLSASLLKRIREEAPGIRIRFVDVPNDLPKWLDNSDIDLALCANFNIWPDLKYEHLYTDSIVVAVAKDHPLLEKKTVNSTDLLNYPSINYVTSNFPLKFNIVETGLPSLDWSNQVSTGQFIDGVLLAVEKPFVARTPAALVDRLSHILPISKIELTGENCELQECMFWASIQHHAQEHIWLRNAVKESLLTAR